MKPFQRKPDQSAIPPRPAFAPEARLTELRKRDSHITAAIIEAEQSGDKSHAYPDDAAKIENEARALARTETKATRATEAVSSNTSNLKALWHERAVVRRAIEIATLSLGDLRSAWAAKLLMERRVEYETSVRHVALAIAALKQAEGNRQAFLTALGAAGRNSGLPCANVNVAAGLNSLKTFTTAALNAGIISKDQI
jgi:hypothetical protein